MHKEGKGPPRRSPRTGKGGPPLVLAYQDHEPSPRRKGIARMELRPRPAQLGHRPRRTGWG
eukprot:13309497-Alexandrium_andersonii.AAC.1